MTQRPPLRAIEHVAAGECARGYQHEGAAVRAGPDAPQPGDFILTHGSAWTSTLIHWGQGLRYRGPTAKYAYWNHTALIVDRDGMIVEALGTGVAARSIHDYDAAQYTVVRIEASDEDRAEAAAFARYCIGSDYGFLTIVSIAISLITGGTFAFAFDGQLICSGLVARALERTTAIFKHDPARIVPAELAETYDVDPPPPSTPKGTPPKPVR